MESSSLSSLHLFPRIHAQTNWFRASSVGLTRTDSIRRCVAEASESWHSLGCGRKGDFGSSSRVLGRGCNVASFGRRQGVRGYVKRWGWHAESEAEGCMEKSVHFVGIGGSGLSALALLALQQGWRVSGSDCAWSEQIEKLKGGGARAYVGHNAALMVPPGTLPPAALVVSSAVGPGNEEVDAALALNVPIYKRDAWLGKITEGYDLIAVAGTHGKSTTSAMLSVVMRSLGEDVSAVVGAQVPQFPDGGNAVCGAGRIFVLESDEYDGCFLGVSPSVAVVTNVEWEHVDMFSDEEAVRDIFKKFVMRIKPGGYLVICNDSAGAKSLLEPMKQGKSASLGTESPVKRRVVTYGLGCNSDWQAIMLVPNPQGGTDYTVVYNSSPISRVSLRLPGMYNVLNSLAVIVVVSLLAAEKELDEEEQARAMKAAAVTASNALGSFSGLRRRFDWVGTVLGCHIIDDYAHHPTEVRAVLQAARQRFDQQPIWVVFQPHTISRLAAFLPDFAPAFSAADRVIVTQVYSARNIQDVKIVTGEDLANAIIGPPAVYIPDLDDVVERLSWELAAMQKNAMNDRGNVVLLTLGAGDITSVGPRLIRALSVQTA